MKLPSAKSIIHLVLAVVLISNLAIAQSTPTPFQNAVSKELCGIVNFVKAIVGILAVVLFMLGGVFYAIGHFLPATGNLRSNVQGWAMGMLMAAIIALIMFLIAQPVVTMIANLGVSAGASPIPISC